MRLAPTHCPSDYHPLGAAPESPVYIESPGLDVPIHSFQGDVMFRRIVIPLSSLTACLVVALSDRSDGIIVALSSAASAPSVAPGPVLSR
jgi:hypothetical protein